MMTCELLATDVRAIFRHTLTELLLLFMVMSPEILVNNNVHSNL
jgi:hypothetical protein